MRDEIILDRKMSRKIPTQAIQIEIIVKGIQLFVFVPQPPLLSGINSLAFIKA